VKVLPEASDDIEPVAPADAFSATLEAAAPTPAPDKPSNVVPMTDTQRGALRYGAVLFGDVSGNGPPVGWTDWSR
jgi:hypothetical protein